MNMGSNARERLRVALAHARVPDTVREAFESGPPDPHAGQIWRAAWQETVEIVLVLRVDAARLAAVPLSLDTGYADENTVVAPAALSSMNVEVAIWAGIERLIPTCVLDRPAGQIRLDVQLASWADEAIAAGARRGRPSHGPADPLNEFRAELEDNLDALAEARWAHVGAGTLPSLLAGSGLDVTALASLAGVPPQRALALRRGQAAVTQEEANLIAPRLGIEATEVLAANPPLPGGLVSVLDHPKRRHALRQLARTRGVSELEARRIAGYGTMALAARQTGRTAGPAWDERLDRYFDAVLGGGA